MKAVNFLEYCKEQDGQLTKDNTKGWHVLNNINRALSFYSQPFTPELIDKYFENIQYVKLPVGEPKVFCGNVEIIFFWKNSYWLKNGTSYETFTAPKTLDDFIADCKRFQYGIKLTFNQTAKGELGL